MRQESDFFATLFAELASRGISYCVLRNYNELPTRTGTDVDMWVAPSEARRFSEVLLLVAQKSGWRLGGFLARIASRPDGNYHFATDDASETINVDLYTSLHWKGIPYLREDVVRSSLRSHPQGFWILLPGVEAASTCIKTLLTEGCVPEKYQAGLASLVRDDPAAFEEALHGAFSRATAMFLRERVENSQWAVPERSVRLLRRELAVRAMARYPFSTLRSLLLYLLARARERTRPKWGAFVVLLGPDGSGKTTLAHALLESTFSRRLFGKRIYLYRRFPLLPELKRFVGWARRGSGAGRPNPTERMEEGEPLGLLRCVMYVSYYGMEYIVGRLWLWWQIGKHRAFVVSDRYFHEYLLQEQFARCPRWLLTLLMKLITQPDALVYLRADPELLYVRKGERSVEELRRQGRLCERWVSRAPNGHVVDSVSEDATLADLQRIVLRVIEAKQKGNVSRVWKAVDESQRGERHAQ